MRFAQIEGHPTLIRDMQSKHIVETDASIVRKHEARAAASAAAVQRDMDIKALKSDVAEIRAMLTQLSFMIAMMPKPQPYGPYNPPSAQPPLGTTTWTIGDGPFAGFAGTVAPSVGGGTYTTGALVGMPNRYDVACNVSVVDGIHNVRYG